MVKKTPCSIWRLCRVGVIVRQLPGPRLYRLGRAEFIVWYLHNEEYLLNQTFFITPAHVSQSVLDSPL